MVSVWQLGLCPDSVRKEGAVRVCQPNRVSRGLGRADRGSLLLGWGRAGSVTQRLQPAELSCQDPPGGGDQLVALTLDVTSGD